MNELLQSIKADLLSRHLLPLLAVAGVALVGAVSYAAIGGAGSKARVPAPTPAAPLARGLPVAPAPANATAAASETPSGIQYQTQGSTRNPFAALAGTSAGNAAGAAASAVKSASGSATKSGSSGSQGTGSSSPSPSSGGTGSSSTPSPTPSHAPSSPSPTLKPETLPFYSVSALFGLAPVKPGEQPTLTPYEEMKRFEPLPAPKAPLIVFVGVSKQGGRAVFALIVPPILRGAASCFPSDTHCEAIELPAGKSEELEYVKSNGETVAFELKVVKIVKRSSGGSGARARALHVSRAGRRALRVSRAGRRALRQAGLASLG